MTEKRKELIIDLVMITVIISVVVLIAYSVNGIYPFGEETIARGDMVQQTIPAGMYYVWDVLHGKASPFFTWNSAFGMNLSGASSLGAHLSPLNLFLLFTSRDNIVNFVNILLILKMISIAIAMYFYLKKYEVKKIVPVAGGILYAFGAASLIHFQIIFVMDAAFLLPLLMIGMDRIFEKKGCKFFIFLFALCMTVNVYTGCIILMFLFLASGMKIFFEIQDKAEKRRCVLWLGISVAAAVLLSTAVSVPALISIGNSPRTSSGSLFDTYRMALQGRWEESEWKRVESMFVNIALPCACILFFPLFEKRNLKKNELKKNKRKKNRYRYKKNSSSKNKSQKTIKNYKSHLILTGFMILSVFVAGTELLWHGGSRAMWPLRFVYMISFVLIDFAVRLFQDHPDSMERICDCIKNKAVFFITGGLLTIFSGVIFFRIYEKYCESEMYLQKQDGFLCIFIELLFIVVYFLILKFKVKGVVLILLCIEMTCTSIISFAPNKDNGATFSPEYLKTASNVSVNKETELKDFERIKNTDYVVDNLEYSLVMGEEAISNYWHVMDASLQGNFSALGYTINWTQLVDTGGTVFTDTLFNIKYFLNKRGLPEDLYDLCEDIEYSDGDVLHLYKNKFELPFVVQTDVSAFSFSDEMFLTQNNLYTALTNDDEQLIQDVSADIADNVYDVDIGADKKILYFYGTNSSDASVSIFVNGAPVYIPTSYTTENMQYPADFCNRLVCLGSFQNQHVNVRFNGNANMYDLHLGLLDYNTFIKGIEGIQTQNPEIKELKQKKSGVKIELDNVTKQNVFLPISYDDNWVCKVNGKKINQLGNMNGMLLIPVESGKNNIELKYVASGRKAGIAVSLSTLLILVVFVWLTWKGKLSIQRGEELAAYAAYAVFLVLYWAFVVAMFVIPLLYYLRDVFTTS